MLSTLVALALLQTPPASPEATQVTSQPPLVEAAATSALPANAATPDARRPRRICETRAITGSVMRRTSCTTDVRAARDREDSRQAVEQMTNGTVWKPIL